MSRLNIYYAIIATVGLLIAGGLIYVEARNVDSDTLLSIGEDHNIRQAALLNPETVGPEESGIVEYTVIENGVISFSTDSSKIGQPFNENSDSMRAKRQSRPVSSLDEQRVTTYLPVENGVAMLTTDVSSMKETLSERRNDFIQAMLFSLVIILAAIGVFVTYIGQRLNQQTIDLSKHNADLMLQLINRADFSYMSLRALQNAFRKLNPSYADANTLRGYQEIESLAGNLALVEKIERLQLSPEKKPFSLDELMRERAAHFKEAEVSLAGNSGLGLIADRAMMAHAIDSILNNINYYNTRRRAIKLSSQANGTTTRITAALPIVEDIDTLPPIDPNQHIDLTVARLMVAAHGGTLEFNYSDGIQFHVVVPSA